MKVRVLEMRRQPATTSDGSTGASTRVLHISDTLGGGGTERLIWDIVRLSNSRVRHKVVTFFPDGFFGPFVYADPLRTVGAYRMTVRPASTSGGARQSRKALLNENHSQSRPVRSSSLKRVLRPAVGKLPKTWKQAAGSVVQRFRSRCQRAWRTLRLYVPPTYRILRECISFRPHIIHVHGFHPFIYGVLLKIFLRRFVVHTVPATVAQMNDQGTGWLTDRYRRHHRYIDKFFLASAYREQMVSLGVPSKKFVCVTGGVDMEEVARIRSETADHRRNVRASLGLPQDAIIALSIGRCHPSKGHQYVLEALPGLVSRFPKLHWIMLGDGEMRPELETRRAELSMEAHAHFAGFVGDPLRFCAAADLFLRTAIFEGDNLSSYSALAMGLPVVGFKTESDWDFLPRVGHGLLATNCDAEDLAKAISQILSLPDHGREMGSLGGAFCAEHLDIRAAVGNFVSTYVALRNE